MRWRPIGGIYSRRWSRGYSTSMSAFHVTSSMHHWIKRPWNHHMINGWAFPSHVHHGDVGGVQPTLGRPHVRVGQPTYCFHVDPTKLLEDVEVGGSVGQVGLLQRWVGRPTLGGVGPPPCSTCCPHLSSSMFCWSAVLLVLDHLCFIWAWSRLISGCLHLHPNNDMYMWNQVNCTYVTT